MGQYPRYLDDSPANGSSRYQGGARCRLRAAPDAPKLAPDQVSARLKHRRQARIARKALHTRVAVLRWLLWLLASFVGVSAVTIGVLVALAPTRTHHGETWQDQERSAPGPAGAEALRVALDGEHFYRLDLDPRQVEFSLLRGWDREQEAFADPDALAFVSGPMYERYYWPDPRLEAVIEQTVPPSSPHRAGDQGYTVPLGDLKFGDEIWRGLNRAAAGQRAFIAVDHSGEVTFGYGELTAERARAYETFIGGLHVLYNDLQPLQPGYKGAYSKGLGQKIRYYLPRVRVVIGLRPDRRLEVLMSKDGLTMEETRQLSRQRGLVAAYLPDHASKSRFIVPGAKGFSEEDANWISGGSVSYVHVPYMIRISRRRQPARLEPNPSLALPQVPQDTGCGGPLSCAKEGLLWAGDRSLSGLNRLMGSVAGGRSLPEPPITADPPASQRAFLPVAPTDAFQQEDGNPASQPWESAWTADPHQPPAGGISPEVAPTPERVWDDMTQPITVPQDAGEDFWEQTFPLLPSLPAPTPEPVQEIPATAPPASHALRQPPRFQPLPTLPLHPVAPPAAARQGTIHQGTTVVAEQRPPSLPTLDMIPDPMPVPPRLDGRN